MWEALADLREAANSESLSEKVKKTAKMAGYSRLFCQCSEAESGHRCPKILAFLPSHSFL
ncbi:MAG: hypothetical protein L0226_13810 [Acidobacteria bacterium]|nr:hypothetical protein [Acidobacteriota bacterium]